MKILSIKKGFMSDHSSTSYEFLAVDKPLGVNEKEAVARLSRRTSPTAYRASFVYHVEGYDIPGGWEKLMEKYYDVMYSEDYGWWTLAIAFDTTKKQFRKLKEFKFRGYEDCGIDIEGDEKRVIVIIYCIIPDDKYFDVSENYILGSKKLGRDNGLLNLLSDVREQLKEGDYRALYKVWEVYYEDEEDDDEEHEMPKEPEEFERGKEIVEDFKNILSTLDI